MGHPNIYRLKWGGLGKNVPLRYTVKKGIEHFPSKNVCLRLLEKNNGLVISSVSPYQE